ncbi:MAG: PEGA domain-containing protein [Aromatoleum sp.]|nr:PEGA domain-containing protein [Aromatoleum sp.]
MAAPLPSAAAPEFPTRDGPASESARSVEALPPRPLALDAMEPRTLIRAADRPLPAAVPRASAPLASPTKERQAVPEAVGRLTVAVTPWGEVFIDGRSRGVSPPLTEIKLAPGRHTIEIRNTTLEPHAETVEMKADETLKIKHKFQ